MRTYNVSLCYSGYARRQIEAEDRDDAVGKALKLIGCETEVVDWER